MTLKVTWIDRGLSPRNPPDPNYPDGLDVEMLADPLGKICSTPLPYPAKRIGFYVIECDVCGLRVMLTTAGRADDPRSVRVNCLRTETLQ